MTESQGIKFSEEAKEEMIALAKSAVKASLKGNRVSFDQVERPELQDQLGCFVTLKNKGELRGCIGRFTSDQPLWKTIQEMAIAAATRDYRFAANPITTGELDEIDVEISVLSSPELVENPEKEIELGRDGVIVELGGAKGTFLPQVATETGWSLDEFLGHCSRDKAGIGWDGWKKPEAKVYRYSAEIVE